VVRGPQPSEGSSGLRIFDARHLKFGAKSTPRTDAQAMDFLTRGHMLADLSAIIGSLDIVFGEIDR
jgi:NADH:ubiquinone oxidoreductase subunit D